MTTNFGAAVVVDGELVSRSPATGAEIGRFPVAGPAEVRAAVDRAAGAAAWWDALGFNRRRGVLLSFSRLIARRVDELADLVRAETGKPVADATVEVVAAVGHLAWAARNARRVLRPRRATLTLLQPEYAARVEYRPYGVVGVIGPWNYPIFTPLGSIGSALAAGNAVVVKPSEYTPAAGAWLVDRLAEVSGEPALLQAVHGLGETGAALCGAGVGTLAFTGSTATGRKVLAACAPGLTPVVLECGGKDAAIVAADADVPAAAEACVWGALTNAGQTCIGLERVYVAAAVYPEFLAAVVDRARRLRVGPEPTAEIGPITVPGQLEIIREHLADALARGAHALLGGAEAVRPPYVHPTILVGVPPEALTAREETFGPVLVVHRVADSAEAVRLANAGHYGLGGAVFSRSSGLALARELRSGMVAVNSALSFAGCTSLPFGGVGASGYGRVHGAAGLREFSWVRSIARRRSRSPVPVLTFDRGPAAITRISTATRWLHGRGR